ncbi:MAG: ParB/RepB/Spo0J family partition protein [Corticimicrobacter sp.]|uniref:ParB/RepB/Spo0J family partition protein n=1 Tax=Corticimicrobacter sp. TaxID=2678536 RepID=UPI0032DB787C
MASKKAPPPQPESKTIDVSLLDFDKKNPRFPVDVAQGSIAVLLERFVRDERLLEIIESIGNNGYFPGEPLLVVKEGQRYRVIEGNRRLAALKLLSGELTPPKGRISVENAIDAAAVRPTKAHCLIFGEESQILRYLGFRHITGIKAWSALQKARYMERLLLENYSHMQYSDGLKLLAKETGSKPAYMGQMLCALKLFERAEKENFYDHPLDPNQIDFSILSTALSYSNVVDYLGLDSRTDIELDNVKDAHVSNLFLWLFVTGENTKSIVGESRNLKKLAAVLPSEAAVDHLLKEGRLDEAFEFSKGPSIAFTEALSHAERRLTAAWQWIPKVSEVNPDHQSRADAIYRLAMTIRSAVESRAIEPASPAPKRAQRGRRNA